MADYTDFTKTVIRGEELEFPVTVLQDGAPVHLSTYERISLIARTSPTAKESAALISLASDTEGIAITDAAAGLFTVTIPGAATQAMSNSAKSLYVDIRATDDLMTWTLAQGKLLVTPVTSTLKPFSPSQIPGLRCWLRADQKTYTDPAFTIAATTEGAAVGGWYGQGGVNRGFQQANSGLQPIKALNVLDGLPAIRADGTDDWLEGPWVNEFVSNATWTIFLVGRATGGTGIEGSYPGFIGSASDTFNMGVITGQVRFSMNQASETGQIELTAPYTLGEYALFEAQMRIAQSTTTEGSLDAINTAQEIMIEDSTRVRVSITNTSDYALIAEWWGEDDDHNFTVLMRSTIAPTKSASRVGDSMFRTTIRGPEIGQTFTFREDFAELALSVNGVNEVVTPCTFPVGLGTPLWLFAAYTTQAPQKRFLAGDILELLIYNTDVSEENRIKMRAYLNYRYGVPAIVGTVS